MPEQPAIETRFCCATGAYTLYRLPERHHPSLRAWDAADDYLIERLQKPVEPGSLLLLNDAFGALSVALHAYQPTLWFDNVVEAKALARNLVENGFGPLSSIPQTEPPPTATQVVIKLPRSSALLDWQLAMLNQHLPEGTPILLGGMLKHVTPADLKVMQARLGRIDASRIVRKARCWRAVTTGAGQLPKLFTADVPEFQLNLINRPGVFSLKKLDPGAACLLDHLQRLDISDLSSSHRAIDLCCGNGVLGLAWLHLYPEVEMHFTDASAAAVSSATASAQANLPTAARWTVSQQDGLAECPPRSADVILCNPPFHQADTITTDVARHLFHEARAVLVPHGRMVVVANRHLGYHQLMKSYFGKVTTLSSDARFVVLEARQPRPTKTA